MKHTILTAAVSSALTLGIAFSLTAAPDISRRVVLENPTIAVTERTMAPRGVRGPHTRPSDQVIVFVNDASYERTDAKTGAKAVRRRKAGDVIWHDRGENAPQLVNVGTAPMRSLVIAIK